ncbi:MAG TPA: GAF domain-containing protein [Chthoniobacterales bacterium]
MVNISASEAEYIQTICRAMVDLGKFPLVWIGDADPKRDGAMRVLAFAGQTSGFTETIDALNGNLECGIDLAGTVIKNRALVVCDDLLAESQSASGMSLAGETRPPRPCGRPSSRRACPRGRHDALRR